jgi:hypothetical protein
MRRILTGLAVAALVTLVPGLALAGNQEMAAQIAQKLRTSGKLTEYKIGVKFNDGTVWLRGVVSNPQQMNAALRLAFQTPGVSRVVNELTLGSSEASGSTRNEPLPVASKTHNPLRDQGVQRQRKVSLASRLESVIARESENDASGDAVPLSTSAAPAAIETVSAESPREEIPQQMLVPQRPMPLAVQRVATTSTEARGPVSPNGGPMPMYTAPAGNGPPARFDQPSLPNYAWPSYAAYPNYAAVTYPKQYSATAWPYIGPFYPYPQVPMGWRKVTLEWDDGWWFLDFKDQPASCWHR